MQRTRQYIRTGYRHFKNWLHQDKGIFSLVPSQAAVIAFPRYHREINYRVITLGLTIPFASALGFRCIASMKGLI